jgi:hypothetical protein
MNKWASPWHSIKNGMYGKIKMLKAQGFPKKVQKLSHK